MTLVPTSILMSFLCNQKLTARSLTISVSVSFTSRGVLGSVICPSWTVIHSNKCKSLFYVVWSVFIDVSVHYWKGTWQILRAESMCLTEMRTGRGWFWFIHCAAVSAAIDFDPTSVWPPLYSTTCLYFTAEFFFFCLVLHVHIPLVCYLNKINQCSLLIKKGENPQPPTLNH